jgi:hypothetical protein
MSNVRPKNSSRTGYILISKSVRKGRRPAEYYAELAKRGIVKTGPIKNRPNLRYISEPDICRCSTCRILGDYRPKVTKEKDCLDFYGQGVRNCKLLDLRSDGLTWICRDCACHDKCSGILEDSLTLCKCKKCKHFLDLGEERL